MYLNSNVLVCFRNRIEKEKKTQSPVNQPKTNPAQPKIPAQSNPARPTSPSPFPLTSARFLGPTFSPLFPTRRPVPLFRGPTTAPRPVTSRVVPHFPARMSAPAPASARPLARRLPLPLARPTGQSCAGTTSVPPARGLRSRPGPQVGATHPRFPFLAQALTDWPTPQLRPLPSFPPPRNSRAREDRRDHRDPLPAAPRRKPRPTPLKPTVMPLRT